MLLSAEEAGTEERVTQDAEVEVGSSNNFPLYFHYYYNCIIGTTDGGFRRPVGFQINLPKLNVN